MNGESRAKRHQLARGDVIEVTLPERGPVGEIRAEDLQVPLVFSDDHLVVVDKPAGMVTHPSRGHSSGTLVHGLIGGGIAGGDDPERPGIVHRLDRDTSGLLLVARDERTHRQLGSMMRDREIERRYLALVHGPFPRRSPLTGRWGVIPGAARGRRCFRWAAGRPSRISGASRRSAPWP